MHNETELELFTPQDAARVCECCAATVKRLADEIRLPVIRTVGGVRLFSRQQVERIQQERDRRAREVIKAWINPAVENQRTIHHLGYDDFMVAWKKIGLKSKMR